MESSVDPSNEVEPRYVQGWDKYFEELRCVVSEMGKKLRSAWSIRLIVAAECKAEFRLRVWALVKYARK
jgi:phosphatidylserine decarboxylase